MILFQQPKVWRP